MDVTFKDYAAVLKAVVEGKAVQGWRPSATGGGWVDLSPDEFLTDLRKGAGAACFRVKPNTEKVRLYMYAGKVKAIIKTPEKEQYIRRIDSAESQFKWVSDWVEIIVDKEI